MGAVLIALMASVALSGCGTFGRIGDVFGGIFGRNHANDFAEMHQKLEREAVRYGNELDKIVDPVTGEEREGVITEPQWNLFEAGVKNVKAVNAAVKADMTDWKATGVRPAMLTPHAEALLKAQNDVIAIVKVVKP